MIMLIVFWLMYPACSMRQACRACVKHKRAITARIIYALEKTIYGLKKTIYGLEKKKGLEKTIHGLKKTIYGLKRLFTALT